MTFTRDEDANSDDFARVIPLRRRAQSIARTPPIETHGPPARDIWDPNAPVAGLAQRASLWESPTATELLVRAPAPPRQARQDASAHSTAAPPGTITPPRARRLRVLAWTLPTAGALALAIVVIAAPHRRVALPAKAAANTTSSSPGRPFVAGGPTRVSTRPYRPSRRPHTSGEAQATRPRGTVVHARRSPAPAAAVRGSQQRTAALGARHAATIDSRRAPRSSSTVTAPSRGGGDGSGIAGGGAASCVPGDFGC